MSPGETPGQPEGRPQRQHVSARVPDKVAPGVFSSGVVVMGAAHELVLDFIQSLVQPSQLVARVILPWHTLPNMVAALRQNLDNHTRRFGRREKVEASPPDPPPAEASSENEADESSPSPGGAKVAAGVSAGRPTQESKAVTRRVEPTGFYDELKIEDEVLIGVYATGAMINHTEFEFKLDFLSTFHPHPIVVARVFMSEPQIRRVLASLEEHEAKRRGGG